MKNLVRVFLALLVLVAVTLVGLSIWFAFEDKPVEASSGAQVVHISRGESLSATSRQLQDAGLIRSAFLFKTLHQVRGLTKSFPAGSFLMPKGLSTTAAVEWFRQAQPIQIRVTVPEGLTSTKIARILAEKEIVSAPEFLEYVRSKELDGMLFPETYLFPLEATVAEVADKMVATFRARTSMLTEGLGADRIREGLVMASVVEREYRLAVEAPLISSVFWNRLERGIPLASCATVEYILTEVQGRPHPKRIFFVHTQIDNPFNTYLNKGLPPAPICNPGLTALTAAYRPAASDYLYFVVKDPAQGSHRFSRSWDDHETARQQYLESYVSKS